MDADKIIKRLLEEEEPEESGEEEKTEFEFDELSDSAKDVALNHFRDVNVDYGDWDEYYIDEFKEKLEELGYNDAEVKYSGFYSSGDGASFSANVNVEKILKRDNDLMDMAVSFFPAKEEEAETPQPTRPGKKDRTKRKESTGQEDLFATRYNKDFIDYIYAKVNQDDNHYYYARTMHADVEDGGASSYLDLDSALEKRVEEFLDQLEGFITEDARGLANEFYSRLRDAYEADTSDEAVRDWIVNNDNKFDEDGEVV